MKQQVLEYKSVSYFISKPSEVTLSVLPRELALSAAPRRISAGWRSQQPVGRCGCMKYAAHHHQFESQDARQDQVLL